MTPEERLAALEELAQLKGLAQTPAAPESPAPVPTEGSQMTPREVISLHSPIGGVAQTATQMFNSAVMGPISGLLGALKFSTTSGTPEERAAAATTRIQNAQSFGYKPNGQTATGTVLEAAAPTIDKVSQWLDDTFYAASGGHPLIATALKTAVEGTASIAGMKGMRPTSKIANSKAADAALKSNLESLSSVGVTEPSKGWPTPPIPKVGEVPDATIRAAQNIAGDPRRGAQLQNTLKALSDAKKTSKRAMDSSWQAFRELHGGVEVNGKPFSKLSDDMRQVLVERGFDIEKSPRASALLDDIKNLATSKTPTEFNHVTGQMNFPDKAMVAVRDLDILRRRASVKGTVRAPIPDEAELGIIREMLDDSMDNIFEETAKEVGKGYMSGAANEAKVRNMVASWKKARLDTHDYYSKFAGPQGAHKQVVKLLRESATPEDVWSYVVGANALSNKLGGVNVVRHIKKILGDTSPAVTDLRQAAVRDILKPLLGEQYDFPGLIKNVDNALENKYSLLAELGVNREQLLGLRKAAVISQEMMRRNPTKFDARYITASSGALMFGNSMAHNSALLRLYGRVIGNRLKEIESQMTLKDMLRKGPNVPIIQSSPSALDYLSATAAGNVPDWGTQDDSDEK